MGQIIEVSGLTKKYRDKSETITALDDVSFSVENGEDLAIVGPSGSGKTTLLELMAGLNTPSKGKVIINGHNVHQGSDEDISRFRNQTIGFVFQMMHLQDYFTAQENVTLPMIAAGRNQKESMQRAAELLEKVGLQDKLQKYPKQLSGGEMQRVAIARALANHPKIILADEPTGKLDRNNANKVLEIFSQLAKEEGMTLVLITHDEAIAKNFPRLIKLAKGKLVH